MLCLALFTLAQITDFTTLPRRNPHTSPADLSGGQRIFMGQCAGCHGPRGEGAKGPSLQQPVFVSARDDYELFGVLRRGIDGTEMPRMASVTDREVWQVIAYVRSLSAVPREAPKGDASRGKALYYGKGGCAACHLNRDGDPAQGRALGPDLSETGARRSVPYLREALLDPARQLPDNYSQVSVTTKDGKTRTMLRLNEDTFSVRLQDLSGAVHAFWKSDLRAYQPQPGQSIMPSYRDKLSAGEIEDLIAYLAGLRGRP